MGCSGRRMKHKNSKNFKTTDKNVDVGKLHVGKKREGEEASSNFDLGKLHVGSKKDGEGSKSGIFRLGKFVVDKSSGTGQGKDDGSRHASRKTREDAEDNSKSTTKTGESESVKSKDDDGSKTKLSERKRKEDEWVQCCGGDGSGSYIRRSSERLEQTNKGTKAAEWKGCCDRDASVSFDLPPESWGIPNRHTKSDEWHDCCGGATSRSSSGFSPAPFEDSDEASDIDGPSDIEESIDSDVDVTTHIITATTVVTPTDVIANMDDSITTDEQIKVPEKEEKLSSSEAKRMRRRERRRVRDAARRWYWLEECSHGARHVPNCPQYDGTADGYDTSEDIESGTDAGLDGASGSKPQRPKRRVRKLRENLSREMKSIFPPNEEPQNRKRFRSTNTDGSADFQLQPPETKSLSPHAKRESSQSRPLLKHDPDSDDDPYDIYGSETFPSTRSVLNILVKDEDWHKGESESPVTAKEVKKVLRFLEKPIRSDSEWSFEVGSTNPRFSNGESAAQQHEDGKYWHVSSHDGPSNEDELMKSNTDSHKALDCLLTSDELKKLDELLGETTTRESASKSCRDNKDAGVCTSVCLECDPANDVARSNKTSPSGAHKDLMNADGASDEPVGRKCERCWSKPEISRLANGDIEALERATTQEDSDSAPDAASDSSSGASLPFPIMDCFPTAFFIDDIDSPITHRDILKHDDSEEPSLQSVPGPIQASNQQANSRIRRSQTATPSPDKDSNDVAAAEEQPHLHTEVHKAPFSTYTHISIHQPHLDQSTRRRSSSEDSPSRAKKIGSSLKNIMGGAGDIIKGDVGAGLDRAFHDVCVSPGSDMFPHLGVLEDFRCDEHALGAVWDEPSASSNGNGAVKDESSLLPAVTPSKYEGDSSEAKAGGNSTSESEPKPVRASTDTHHEAKEGEEEKPSAKPRPAHGGALGGKRVE